MRLHETIKYFELTVENVLKHYLFCKITLVNTHFIASNIRVIFGLFFAPDYEFRIGLLRLALLFEIIGTSLNILCQH